MWDATLDKSTCGTFDLFLMVLVRMGVFYSISRCGQIGKIPLSYTLPFPWYLDSEWKNNGMLPRSWDFGSSISWTFRFKRAAITLSFNCYIRQASLWDSDSAEMDWGQSKTTTVISRIKYWFNSQYKFIRFKKKKSQMIKKIRNAHVILIFFFFCNVMKWLGKQLILLFFLGIHYSRSSRVRQRYVDLEGRIVPSLGVHFKK